MEEKNLQLDRLVFFSDAVIAIAITLLALDIRLEHIAGPHLQFSDIFAEWKTFAAFFLSFSNIANFWKTHHTFFAFIKKIDERMLWFNITWLLFIVLLPFCTSLVSNYFGFTAILIYSVDILLISTFQNMIWDYASDHHFLNNEHLSEALEKKLRAFCNLDMVNALVGIALSFISPIVAFITLFTKLPIGIFATIYYRNEIRQQREHNRQKTDE